MHWLTHSGPWIGVPGSNLEQFQILPPTPIQRRSIVKAILRDKWLTPGQLVHYDPYAKILYKVLVRKPFDVQQILI